MAWQCAECDAVEGESRDNRRVIMAAVCHHCGEALCILHRVMIEDDVFGADPGRYGRTAYHCEQCKKKYHSRAAVVAEQVPL